MPYKDKDKQKQAQADWVRQKRAKEQGSTQARTAASLPASVPEPVRSRYARGEPEYMATIDRLLAHTLDELKAQAVWIPVWRYTAGTLAMAWPYAAIGTITG